MKDQITYDLAKRVEELEEAVRKHRDFRGDDRCWLDDEELYKVLPEGYFPPIRDSRVEMKNCEKFISCRHNPATEYVSPQRVIEELEQKVKELEEKVADSADRMPAQILGTPRSSKWNGVRAAFLEKNPSCAACGGKKNLEVHHVKPYHLFPGLELDPENLITLCDRPGRNCHFAFGHLWSWWDFNPTVRELAALMLSKLPPGGRE